MISEWLYWLTCEMGGCFNNAVGMKNEPYSNLLSGITILWMLVPLMVALIVCLTTLLRIHRKENK